MAIMSNISKIIDPSNPFPLLPVEMIPSLVLLLDPRYVLLYYIPHFILTIVSSCAPSLSPLNGFEPISGTPQFHHYPSGDSESGF